MTSHGRLSYCLAFLTDTPCSQVTCISLCCPHGHAMLQGGECQARPGGAAVAPKVNDPRFHQIVAVHVKNWFRLTRESRRFGLQRSSGWLPGSGTSITSSRRRTSAAKASTVLSSSSSSSSHHSFLVVAHL